MLRALAREPGSGEALQRELEAARGVHADYDRALAGIKAWLASTGEEQAFRARWGVERLALLLQARLLLEASDPDIAALFCATRLGSEGGRALGTLPSGAPVAKLLASCWAG